MLVTRIAPTPSGYLHVGNAVNFVLTRWLAERSGARLVLRIDDFDRTRTRPEYVADIFTTLQWLGIGVDLGPADPGELERTWSMSTRRDQLAAARDALLADHPESVFVCRCSRTELDGQGRCVAGCRDRRIPLTEGRSVVRLHVPEGVTESVGGAPTAVEPGDHVLWRRDDQPAYHLGSVVVDEDLGVTTIVRGVDLLAASALQRHLARLLGAPNFLEVDLRHHGLLRDEHGAKLSKSAGGHGHPLAHTPALREQIDRWAAELGAPVAIYPP